MNICLQVFGHMFSFFLPMHESEKWRVLIHSQWLHPQDLITPQDSPSSTGEFEEGTVHNTVIIAVSYEHICCYWDKVYN